MVALSCLVEFIGTSVSIPGLSHLFSNRIINRLLFFEIILSFDLLYASVRIDYLIGFNNFKFIGCDFRLIKQFTTGEALVHFLKQADRVNKRLGLNFIRDDLVSPN